MEGDHQDRHERNPWKERIRHWSWLLSKFSFWGGKYTTFIFFVSKCPFKQMTCEYLTGLTFVLFSYIQSYKCLMRSAVCVYVDKWFLCNRTAPGVLMDWIGCQPQTKASPTEKGVKDLVFDSEELEDAGWVGGVTERSKWIRVELTRGVPSPAWEKKARLLGKSDVPDTHGALIWGLVTPEGLVRL